MNLIKSIFVAGILFLILPRAAAQVQIKGNVYDSIGRTPVPLVSVLSSSGAGTMTGVDGSYSLLVHPKDSIWFSYLNKPTRKFPVATISTPYAFDISLRISIPDLPEVRVKNRDYHLDSLENRENYRKYFDFQKPGLSTMSVSDGFGAAFDLDEIVNAFRFRRTKKLTRFRDKLIADEQEGYVRYRFSKALIRRITGMTDDSLINDFITIYQPGYYFTTRVNDYTFHEYIKKSYERFRIGLPPPPLWKEGATGDEGIRY
ncbi:carboxypeptidase-like regulatory domain-containing protein [Niabella beijingensis]|uniref:carboxypeptidase-like regulatory domain-containing protein n=1 Tax=Niabella beijingensis TaxID=2872700 RepID=UPI001CBD62B4|nr:carboxypeptidase-like regulatory domain-containing protein [Niabella beijingensis]